MSSSIILIDLRISLWLLFTYLASYLRFSDVKDIWFSNWKISKKLLIWRLNGNLYNENKKKTVYFSLVEMLLKTLVLWRQSHEQNEEDHSFKGKQKSQGILFLKGGDCLQMFHPQLLRKFFFEFMKFINSLSPVIIWLWWEFIF
jgi:hypothetical protein